MLVKFLFSQLAYLLALLSLGTLLPATQGDAAAISMPPLSTPPYNKRVLSQHTSTAALYPGFQVLEKLNAKDPYLVYYGRWTDDLVKQVREHFKLVILHSDRREFDPKTKRIVFEDNLTREQLALFHERGVKLFAYISIGEDGLTSAPQSGSTKQKPATGKGDGPCYVTGGGVMTGPPNFKCEKKGVASYYLDQAIKVKGISKEYVKGNGKPDRNSAADSGSLYVNPYDATWRKLVEDEARRIMSIKLKDPDGKEYDGYSGIFLDTLDMGLKEEYEWAQEGIRDIIGLLNQVTQNIIINRGTYFFKKGTDQAKLEDLKTKVWGVMFENFFTEKPENSNAAIKTPYWKDYKDNFVPQLTGFQVFALDYLNCSQPDYDQLAKEQHDEVAKLGWLNYVSWTLDETIRYEFLCEKNKK